MAILKALVILVAFVAYAQSRATNNRRRPNFDCEGICRSQGYNPVCSDDRWAKTYDNECFLDCNWKYIGCQGRCPCRQGNNNNARQRPQQQNSWNGQQFRSQSQSRQQFRTSSSQASPPYRPSPQRRSNMCICDGSVDPVCTTEGTERNECLAQCHNKQILYEGECWLRRP